MKNLFFFLLPAFALMALSSCGGVSRLQKVLTSYVNTEKAPKDTTLTYSLPTITPAPETKQMQVKGGVSISCEVIGFNAVRSVKQFESVTYKNPDRPGYDVFETYELPAFDVQPKEVQFKIRLRNNQDRVLKLIDVPIVYIADGVQYSIPSDVLLDWNNALLVKGFEKEFNIRGPQIQSLANSKVIYLSINDIPTNYDKAGNVTNKENFEWFFNCGATSKSVQEKITYSYVNRPIHREKCASCSGVGHFESVVQCSICKGRGQVANKEGKAVQCYTCGGKGKLLKKDNCTNCGGIGEKAFPKSPSAKIASQQRWDGWRVEVYSNPPGASVKTVNANTGQYESSGLSNSRKKIEWLSTASNPSPIIVAYEGKEVKVLPYDSKGKPSGKIEVDFLGATPDVRLGRRVN